MFILGGLPAPLVLLVVGGFAGEVPAPHTSGPSLVFVVGGVGGLENLTGCTRLALKWAGVSCEVREFDWTHGRGRILKDLQDVRNHAEKAELLADRIVRARAAAPDRPIFVIARSGGTMLALTAAAKLPAGTLERIILLSPAVSPHYDLGPALRATRQEIVSFNSDLDWFVLGLGTTQFGTADRFYRASAGLTGFVRPDDDPETQQLYRRLIQVRWNPAMILHGHTGGHLGTVVLTFLVHDVAPWLRP